MSATQTRKSTAKPTRKPAATKTAPATAPEPVVSLAELEQLVVDQLRKTGTDGTFDSIKSIGNPIVKDGRLRFYRAERWGRGEWISAAVLKRIRDAVSAGKPKAKAKPKAKPVDLETALEQSLAAK